MFYHLGDVESKTFRAKHESKGDDVCRESQKKKTIMK